MKKMLLLPAALAIVLMAIPDAPAQAQGVSSAPANTRAARRAREQSKGGAVEAPQKYPKASRIAPKQVGEAAVGKQLAALFALQQEDDSDDKIIALADQILADKRANAFDKSSAAYLAGAAWQNKSDDDYSQAIKYYRQAVEANGLSNNTHYQAMLQLAQLLNIEEQRDEALKWVDRFLSETQSDDATALGVKNQILMGMDNPQQAIAFLEKQAAAKPDDKKVQMNLAASYQQAGQEDKALALLERIHKAGLFTESTDYEVAWRLLANAEGREKDALAMIDEGLSKGVMKPSYESYAYQAQVWYENKQVDKAIEAWSKAAPLGKDGQSYLNLAQAMLDKNRLADAKEAAKSARDKGLKKPGLSWQVTAQAETELGNKTAAIAAIHEAAKYPETKKWADSMLRTMGGK